VFRKLRADQGRTRCALAERDVIKSEMSDSAAANAAVPVNEVVDGVNGFGVAVAREWVKPRAL